MAVLAEYLTQEKKDEIIAKYQHTMPHATIEMLIDEIANAITEHSAKSVADLAAGAELPVVVSKVNELLAALRLARLMSTA